MLRKIIDAVLDFFILIGVFYLICFLCGYLMRHPIAIIVALGIESIIFVPWEIQSRKNNKTYYEKGGSDYEHS